MSKLAAKMAASGWTPAAGSTPWGQVAFASSQIDMSAELVRIMTLPRRQIDLQQVQDLSPLFVHTEYCGDSQACGELCDERAGRPAALRPIQSAALFEMEQYGGLLGPIGVGYGKELIADLAAHAFQAKCTVVLSLANLRATWAHDWQRYARHFLMPSNVHFVSYHDLSNAKTADILERIKPDLIVANEAHKLRHKTAACTKRFLRYMRAHPDCRLVTVSGTMTNDSIKDYAHLSELSLGKGSPVPSPSLYGVLSDWARALDVPKPGIEPAAPGALLKMATLEEMQASRLAGESPNELARAVYRRRLVETGGVVATEEGAIGSTLILNARGAWPSDSNGLKVPQVVTDFLAELSANWAIPGGEEIDSPLEMARVARQASCGFYYVWDWPGGVKDFAWLDARARWRKAVAHILRYAARDGLDSPLLVARAAALGHALPGDANAAWAAWLPHKDKPKPPTAVVWLDPFVVLDAVDWARAEQQGIIWYNHDAIGDALAGALGLPQLGGGTDDYVLQANPSTSPIMVCSIAAHGTGKNLQAWSRGLVTAPPANGTTWEQLLGREHRPGQKADEVQFDVNTHTSALLGALLGAIEDARYQQQTTGARQKLLYANRIGF